MQAHWSNLPNSPGETYLNPLVRVSYTSGAYRTQNSVSQIFLERIVGHFVAWAYDIRDWWAQCRLAQRAAERRMKVREWEQMTGLKEVGEHCLDDRLQLLTPWGWAHV